MLANAKSLAVIAACALVAQAQTTTTAPASAPSAATACIVKCATDSLSKGNCTSLTDLTCVCGSTSFQQAVASCIQGSCPPTDVAIAAQMQQQQCAAVSSNASSSATSTSASSETATSASATQSASGSSAAMALSAPFSFGGLIGTFVASAGALVGAAFIL